jgi:hypothetical protein
MALSSTDLNELKARCQKAIGRGHEVGKGDMYLAELAAELRRKLPSGTKATPTVLLDLLAQVESARAGKPVKAPSPPPVVEDEDEDDEGEDETDEDEDETKSNPVASKKPAKKPSSPKKKKR